MKARRCARCKLGLVCDTHPEWHRKRRPRKETAIDWHIAGVQKVELTPRISKRIDAIYDELTRLVTAIRRARCGGFVDGVVQPLLVAQNSISRARFSHYVPLFHPSQIRPLRRTLAA